MAHNRYNNRFCLKSFELNHSNQNFFFGVPMSLQRVGWVAAIALVTLFEISCGQVYRPVVFPINVVPPNPANFHAVFGISANVPYTPGTALQIDVSGDSDIGQANMGLNPTHAAILPNNSRVFVASAGSLLAGGTDVITAFYPAGDSPTPTGLGTPTTFTLPNVGANQTSGVLSISEVGTLVTMTISAPLINAQVSSTIIVSAVVIPPGTLPAPGCPNPPAPTGYDGHFSILSISANGTTIQFSDPISCLTPLSNPGGSAIIPVPLFCAYLPDFVATTQNNTVFVSNYGVEAAQNPNCTFSSTDSVMQLNSATSTITNIAYLCPTPAACPAGPPHPVAMVETPDGQNLYVLNQGANSVMDLSPTDLSTLATIPVGNSPAWAVARPDSRRVYVVTQGTGELYTINTVTNTLLPSPPQSVGGAGANFVIYDKSLNRLYVTNPAAGKVYVFDATTDPPTPLGSPTGAVSIPAPPQCTAACSAVMPVSVAALPDASRFYVASYATAAACPDTTVGTGACVIPQVTVFDALSLTVKTTIFPLLSPVVTTTGTTTTTTYPFAVAPSTFCAPVGPAVPYTLVPGVAPTARFRMSAAAAVDSSRVYASICDSGTVAIVNTTTASTATGGTNTPDTLVGDLPAPFSAATVPSGEPAPQNPVFLLTGQ